MDKLSIVRANISASIEAKEKMLADEDLIQRIALIVDQVVTTYKNGGKVLFCGNGGSAADAQHLAAELSGRYYYDRPPLAAEALHVNTSYLTAVANDYSYDQIYSRLIQAIGNKGDVLIGLSTSGNSPNVVKALSKAQSQGCVTVGLAGRGGGAMKTHCDFIIEVDSQDTPRIQECHMLIGHTICQLVEKELFPNS